MVIDGGDGVSSVGEWIGVVHDGVEGLCSDTGDGVVLAAGEGVLLYVCQCDGGDGVSCEGMHGDRLLSKRVSDEEMFCDRSKGSGVNGGDEGSRSVLDVQCGGDLWENLLHLALWYLSLLCCNNNWCWCGGIVAFLLLWYSVCLAFRIACCCLVSFLHLSAYSSLRLPFRLLSAVSRGDSSVDSMKEKSLQVFESGLSDQWPAPRY